LQIAFIHYYLLIDKDFS